MKRFAEILIIITFLFTSLPMHMARAFDYNPNNILTDFELKDKDSMSLSAIQAFLNKYDSPLKEFTQNVDGQVLTVAEIIYRVAQKHIISPKFILTKLDHEQCLIRGCSFLKDPQKLQKAIDWATGFAVCTGCDLSDPRIQKYKGFFNQVDALASVQNDYIRKVSADYIYGKGDSIKTLDGYIIVPENQATANLYTYTPYRGGDSKIGGNYFFAKLWTEYWGRLFYPDGTVLMDGSNNYWLIDGGTKRLYTNQGAFLSAHAPGDAITVSSTVLDEYERGPDIRFANYSLVKDETDKVYLLVDDKKRLIEDAETFRLLGFHPEEVERVQSKEITHYKNAVPITKTAMFPQGFLAKEAENGQLYYLQNGFKYLVSREVAELNYPNVEPSVMSSDEIATLYPGGSQKITDGKLVKDESGKMYAVSRGVLRPVATVSDFIDLFGEEKLAKAVQIPDSVIALHEIGDPIESPVERNKGQVAGDRTTDRTYYARWARSSVPQTMMTAKTYHIPVAFVNKNSQRWEKGEVELHVEETGHVVPNTDIVLSQAEYTFTVPVVLREEGIKTLSFKLYSREGVYVQGGFYQAKITAVKPDYQAEIVVHTLPVAVRNVWTRVPVEVKIKNTGEKAWVRKKTGLKLLEASQGQSIFYDSSDWVDKEIASVSLEPSKAEIAPGEQSIFRFTIKVKDVPAGTRRYRLELFMKKDNNERVYLNGREFYEGIMRVDS